jgi:hypothetical protein
LTLTNRGRVTQQSHSFFILDSIFLPIILIDIAQFFMNQYSTNLTISIQTTTSVIYGENALKKIKNQPAVYVRQITRRIKNISHH